MRNTRFRLAAVLTALLLLLGVLPAMAEAPSLGGIPMPDTNMQVDIQVAVSPMLGSLISSFTGAPSDEATQSLITTITSAINKLKTSIVSGKAGLSGTVGTETGDLFDFQASFDKESMQNGLTASFLPGLMISLDPAAVQSVLGQTAGSAIDPAKVKELAQPYLSLVQEAFAQVQSGARSEEGSFEIENYGSFVKRSEFSITTHMLSDLLGKFGETLEKDTKTQEFLKQIASNTRPEGSEEPSIDELLGDIREEAAKGKAEADKPVLDVVSFTGSDGRLYLDMVSPQGSESPFKIDLLLVGMGHQQAAADSTVDLKIKVKGGQPTAGEAPADTAIDWKLVEQGILDGTDSASTLVTLKVDGKKDEAAVAAQMALSMSTTGMSLGVNVASNTDLTVYESQSVINLSFMFPEPLLTLTINAKPTEQEPKAPVAEGAATLLIKEEMAQEEEQLLSASLQKAVPDLLTRLQAALPEEAPAILALLNPPQPEPAPEGGGEAMPEPAPATPNP